MVLKNGMVLNGIVFILVSVSLSIAVSPDVCLSAEGEIISLLEARLQHGSRYSWSFDGEMFQREPIDWTKASVTSDPLQEIHSQGFSAFKPIAGQKWIGISVSDAIGGKFKFEFEMTGKKYASYSDGKSFVTATPTQMGEGDGPSLVEIGAAPDVGKLGELAVECAGYDYAPFRIRQFWKCFGSQEKSIYLADFIHLLRNEAIEKEIRTQDDKFVVSFPAFTDEMRSGDVIYTFDNLGTLEFIAWKAGKHWSASYTVEITNEAGPNGIKVPSNVKYIDWSSARARNFDFSNWSIPDDTVFGFDIPEGAIVNDHVNQLSYTNVGNASAEARAMQLYALQHDLALPPPARRIRRTSVLLLGFIFALGIALVVLRKWKHGSFFLIPLAILLSSSGCRESDLPGTPAGRETLRSEVSPLWLRPG